MWRRNGSCLLIWWFAFATVHAYCDELAVKSQLPPRTDDNVIESFAVEKNGNFLLIPVNLGDQEYRFILDTGCSISVFDTGLKELLVETPHTLILNGTGSEALYQSNATVGRTKGRLGKWCLCMDLKFLSDQLGQEIHGILGLDFLRSYVVELDFDNGQVSLLRSAKGAPGERLEMGFDQYDRPTVVAKISGLPEMSFLIDTGMDLSDEGAVSPATFDALLHALQIESLGTRSVGTIYQTNVGRLGICRELSLAGFQNVRHHFHESNTGNAFGLKHLSRYLVTLDFPGRALYFVKGKNFDRPSTTDRMDISLRRAAVGEIVVSGIDVEGAAYRSGLRKGDVILEVDRRETREMALQTVEFLMCEPRANGIAILAQHQGTKPHSVKLLPHDRPYAPATPTSEHQK